MTQSQMKTVAEVAAEFRVNASKVISWIATGELRAIDVSQQRGGPRGRWRIERSAVEAFKAARENTPPAAPTKRRRRSASVADEF